MVSTLPKHGLSRLSFLAALALGAIAAASGVGCGGQRELSAQETADRKAIVEGNNRFAFDLYGQLRQQEGNLFFSPASVSTALAMTSVGARGQTAEQMNKALHFSLEQDRLHPAFGLLHRDFNDKHKGYQLSVANALWGQKGYSFLTDFVKLTKDHYGAGFQEVDFAGDAEQARQTINAWVEKQTQDKIKELFKPNTLNADSRLVLTNAIYFKGDWAKKFDKQATRDESFLGTAQKIKVPLMRQSGKFKYLAGDTFQALELPYVGMELSMVILLPKKVDGLSEFEKSLTAANLAAWLEKMRETEMDDVLLPRFKTTAEFQLNRELTALGMTDAFVPDKADFSGMNGKRDLFISRVVHKAFVDVNEEGTEAAAATGVEVGVTSAPAQRNVFRADHPFMFLIRDNRFGGILFLGRLVNP